ncbi:MAG: MltA domain-containing protein [Alphaproteobacteria bacterium]|nr:MltA domain-containing protein [Alphaproteobacteria bacterium]
MPNVFSRRFLFVPLVALLLLSACEDKKQPAELPPPEDGFYLRAAGFDALPGWAADDHAAALETLRVSCVRINKRPADAPFFAQIDYAGSMKDWQTLCLTLPENAADARAFFESQFIPYEIWADPRHPQTREGLFTGYYEPQLRAAAPDDEKATPLYARPDDLITVNLGDFRPELKGEAISGRIKGTQLVPYHTRAEIEAGALTGRAEVLAQVDDPVDAFFLHIQGSGQVVHADGSIDRIGYAAQNGHKYVAVGRELIARGAMAKEDVSMQSIRAWLEQNPDEAQDLMNANPSFIFFQRLGETGPLGAEGVVLTPHRSLAVDRRRIPYGAPVFMDVPEPEGAGRLSQLMIAQDTGGAIRGAVRGDYFWGAGEEAAHKAGLMKSRGHAWLLLPRGVTLPETVSWRADMPPAKAAE